MNRNTGIVIALFLAVLCTVLIYMGAARKYAGVTRTIRVLQASEYIPAGERIDNGMVQAVDVPQEVARDLAAGDAVGQFTRVPVVKGQLLMRDDLSATGRDLGYAEVYVSVDIPSSACAASGDYVDVYTKSEDNNSSMLLYKKAKVLDTVDSSARETGLGGESSATSVAGSGVVAAIGIAVPDDQVIRIVGPASLNQIYLVKSALSRD